MQFLWGPSNMFQYISIATATVLHNDLADIIAWVHRYAWYAYGAVHSNLTVLDPHIDIMVVTSHAHGHVFVHSHVFDQSMTVFTNIQCSFDFLLIQFCWAGNNQVWGWFIKISQKKDTKVWEYIKEILWKFPDIYIHIYLQYNNHQVEVKVQVHLQVLNLQYW